MAAMNNAQIAVIAASNIKRTDTQVAGLATNRLLEDAAEIHSWLVEHADPDTDPEVPADTSWLQFGRP